MKHVRFDENLDDLVDLYRRGMPPGCSTGWPSLDRLLTIGSSRVTVITGVPNHGKSAWIDALAINLIDIPLENRPWRFMICSPEQMPLALHRAKLLELWAGKRFRRGENRMSEAEARKHAQGELARRIEFVMMDEKDTFGALMTDAYSWCQKVRAEKQQPGVVLDPWNALEHNRPRDMSESDYTGEALEAARRLVRKTGAHLFIVAHPAKPPPAKDGKRPIPDPYSISGSAHWYNKPDNCVCIWRLPTALPGDSEYQVTHVLVQKVRWRHEGYQGDITLLFEDDSGRYTDPDAGKQPPREIPREPGEDLPE